MSRSAKSLRFLVAPNAFKECLPAARVAHSIKEGLSEVFPEENIHTLPLADGGDGSLEVLKEVLSLRLVERESLDPTGKKIKAPVGYSENGEAFIEMAAASGLHLLKNEERNAGLNHSLGTGILVREAVSSGAGVIHLFAGGTASMDGGTGILRGLGYSFRDTDDLEVPPGGIHLGKIRSVSPPSEAIQKSLRNTVFKIYCDVDNPLLGEQGCVPVFAAQKDNGLTDLNQLEASFAGFFNLLSSKKSDGGVGFPGSGAAGGTPFGLSAFLQTEILQGAENILDLCGFDRKVQSCDFVITGEGKLDDQSFEGKAPVVIARRARALGKKVIFIGGAVPDTVQSDTHEIFDSVFSILPGPAGLEESMSNASLWLKNSAFQIGRLLFAMDS